MNWWVNLPLLLLLIVTAAGAIVIRDLIGAIFILGSYSFFLALLWAWLGAADVAFTEAVVGAGLSTIFFVVTLFQTSPIEGRSRRYRGSWVMALALALLGVLLVSGARDLPRAGDPESRPNSHIAPIYLERSREETKTPNVVTAILMDYRGLDTLIETTVIFTAGIACSLILRRRIP